MGVYKRGKTYYMDFILNGQRVNRSTGCKERGQALRKEQEEYNRLLQEAVETDEPTEVGHISLSEVLEEVYRERWSRTTSGDRSRAYVVYIIREFGDKPLGEVNKAWLRFISQKLVKDRNPATVNRYLANLRVVLNFAKEEYGIQVPPVRLYRERSGRTRVITQDEQERLTAHLRENYNPSKQAYWPIVADLVDFLCETGLRVGEALHLTEKNFNREGVVELFPEDTKTHAARSVPLSHNAQSILERRGYRPFQDIDHFQAARAFKKAREDLDIDESDFCLHACRHTFASRLLASGQVQLYHIKTLLGHTAWTTTERYSHFATSELESAISVLNE